MAKLTKFAKKELKAFKRDYAGRLAFSRDDAGNTGLVVSPFPGAKVVQFTSAIFSRSDQDKGVKIRRKYGEWLAMRRYQDQQSIPVHVYAYAGDDYKLSLKNACDCLAARL